MFTQSFHHKDAKARSKKRFNRQAARRAALQCCLIRNRMPSKEARVFSNAAPGIFDNCATGQRQF
jgi:hypothetical protein